MLPFIYIPQKSLNKVVKNKLETRTLVSLKSFVLAILAGYKRCGRSDGIRKPQELKAECIPRNFTVIIISAAWLPKGFSIVNFSLINYGVPKIKTHRQPLLILWFVLCVCIYMYMYKMYKNIENNSATEGLDIRDYKRKSKNPFL